MIAILYINIISLFFYIKFNTNKLYDKKILKIKWVNSNLSNRYFIKNY